MRWIPAAFLVLVLSTSHAVAQQTLDHPVGSLQTYRYDSGGVANRSDAPGLSHQHVVRVENAAWLRLHFKDVELEKGSYLRVTSLLDRDVQVLDAANLALWGNSTAYFNGDAVSVELIADAKTTRNRFSIVELERERLPGDGSRGDNGQCGICDTTDDRVPSSETWSCRLLPAGCTASVWNEYSCLVSAGHCIGGSMVVQFNVPDSLSNCAIVNPPAADQFPISAFLFSNNGVGDDWSVLTPGNNGLGQLPFDRYGTFRPIASVPAMVGQTAEMFGYGVDLTCTRSQTQQYAFGPINSVLSNYFRYSVDLRGGNSGSSLIRDGEIIGIATHCPCPNYATRIDLPAFVAARAQLCTPPDFDPPQPDPMSFAVPPTAASDTAVTMTATTATDVTPPVQYMFQCTSATPGGTNSFWQLDVVYGDNGLLPNSSYSYKVAARDSETPIPNQTAFSSELNVTTAIETPQGLATGIVGTDSIQLVALGTFTNLTQGQSGLYFDSLTPGGDTGINVWVQGTSATATGLTPDTDYEFVVKARNRDGVETVFCDPISVHTYWVGGDCNNDGAFTVESDMDCIVEALLGNETSPPGGAHRIDLNYDEITDGQDIQFIADCLLYGGC